MSESNNSQTNIIRDLQRANEILAEVTASLESQKAILKQRGLNLPPLVTSTLNSIRNDLQTLESDFVDEQTELGQLRALANMSANITTSLDIDTVLEETMEIVIALTRAERGYLVLVDAETGEQDFRVARDDSIAAMKGGISGQAPQISRTILNEVISTRQPLLADNAYKDERLSSGASVANFSLRSVLCVPLMYKDEIQGVVYTDNRLQSGIFTEREKNTLMAFANTAAVAIANARLYADIQRLLHETQEVKELMDNVFASIGSGVIATDEDNTITTFNRAASTILEMPETDTVGRAINAVLPKVSADFSEHLANIRENEEDQLIETEMDTQERGRIAVHMKMSPLKNTVDNSTQGIAIVVDDITQQLQAESELRVMKTYLPPEMVENIHTISQLALGGERREVTCLFVETRPISTMKDVRPTEMMDILNQFLAVATQCIFDTQGVIDKYMGQEVMAMWNTQLNPMADHSKHAIDCALLMRERFVELYKELGIDPDPHYYRTGIHSGVATLGNVGSLNRRDFTAIGDTINLSKRLEENATLSQIIISQDTLDHLNKVMDGDVAAYRFEENEPITVKGRTQKTRIYEVFKS